MTDPKNTEDQKLSLDQLKDAAGGFGAKMNRMASTKYSYGVTSIECKVPPSFKKPQDKINNTGDDQYDAGGVVESLRSDNRF